jgi:hypothetical protein
VIRRKSNHEQAEKTVPLFWRMALWLCHCNRNANDKQHHTHRVGSPAANSLRKLQIVSHQPDPLCVDRAQLSVLHQSNEICLCGLLKGVHRLRRPSKILSMDLGGHLLDQLRKRQPPDEQICCPLILLDFSAPSIAGSEFF